MHSLRSTITESNSNLLIFLGLGAFDHLKLIGTRIFEHQSKELLDRTFMQLPLLNGLLVQTVEKLRSKRFTRPAISAQAKKLGRLLVTEQDITQNGRGLFCQFSCLPSCFLHLARRLEMCENFRVPLAFLGFFSFLVSFRIVYRQTKLQATKLFQTHPQKIQVFFNQYGVRECMWR